MKKTNKNLFICTLFYALKQKMGTNIELKPIYSVF